MLGCDIVSNPLRHEKDRLAPKNSSQRAFTIPPKIEHLQGSINVPVRDIVGHALDSSVHVEGRS